MARQERPLTIVEVAERLGLKRATIDQYRRDGTLPEPDDMYGRTPVWLPSTIDGWKRPGQGAGGGPKKRKV